MDNDELDDLPAVMTAEEVARLFRVSKETIRRMTAKGTLMRIEGFNDLLYCRRHILAVLDPHYLEDQRDARHASL